ncbi:MAG: C25 family cysteine peptidase [Planctomycetota bacterium]
MIQGVGSITTGGGNNATTITVSNAADSLKIKSLDLLNGTSSCTIAANSQVTVDSTMTWTNGDLTLNAGSRFYHPGMTIPTGEVMTCNNTSKVYCAGTWTFDGTYTANACETVFRGDSTLTGTTAPTFSKVSVRLGTTVTQSIDVSFGGTWYNLGTWTSASNKVTATASHNVVGKGSNNFYDLTISAGTMTLTSLTTADASLHVQGTLQIDGVLACGGPNCVTVDGTWDNNNGAAGFTEGADPASTARGSRVVFGGTTVNMPDVDETFMDVEIKATVSAVARAHYNINRTWWASQDTFSPSTYTVTFDTALEYNDGTSYSRGILVGEGTFNNVHINSASVVNTPCKRLYGGQAILKCSSLRVDGSQFNMTGACIIKATTIVFSSSMDFLVESALGIPTITDRGAKLAFNIRGSADIDINRLNVKNLNNSGMVIESTANEPGNFDGLAFTDDSIGATGVYVNYQRTNDGGGGPNWEGLSFDANCQYNIQTVAGYTDQITLRSWSGAKGGQAYENDGGAGVVVGGDLVWDAFYWTGAVDDDFNDAGNWYPSGGPPGANETAIVSTDNVNRCQINVDVSVGSLIILSGGVVTCDGGNVDLDIPDGGFFIEGANGDAPGCFYGDSVDADFLTVDGNWENYGTCYFITAANIDGDLVNGGDFRCTSSSTTAYAGDGGVTNLAGGTLRCTNIGTWTFQGNFTNAGDFYAGRSRFLFNGTSQQATMGGDSFHTLELFSQNGSPLTLTVNDDLDITGCISFDNSGTGTSLNTLKLLGNLTFTGFGRLDLDFNGGSDGVINFAGSSAQTIPIPTAGGTNYFQLQVSNTHASGASLSSGITTCDSTFTIADGGKAVGVAGATLRTAGNFTNNGTFTASTSKVIIGGGGTKTIGGDTATTFYNLNFENATTVNVSVTEVGHVNEFSVGNILRNDGTFTQGTSTVIFTGAPASASIAGVSTTTFDTIKITGTFEGGTVRFGVANTFWNVGTFNRGTSKVHFRGTDCQITGTTDFYAVTQDSGKLTLGTGDDITIRERFAVWANSTLDMRGNPLRRLGKGMKVYGTFTADGSTPKITNVGSDYAFAISGASAVVDINKLDFANPDNNGLTVESTVNNGNIDIDGVNFTNADLTQTGTYLRLLQTTIAANEFSFSGCAFDNNCQYNVSTVNNVGVADAGVVMSGYSGARSGETYENDKGAGSVASSSIQWPSKSWVGSVSQSWNDGNNWSPVGVPGASDTVLIPKVDPGNDTPIVDTATVTIVSLQVNSGGVLTCDNTHAAYTFRVTSNITVKPDEGDGDGVIRFQATGASSFIGEADLTNQGTMEIDSATFQVNGVLTNSGTLDASEATTTTLNGSLTNQSGGTYSAGTSTTITGNWANSATFTANTGTVTFSGTGTIASGGSSFYRAVVASGASPTANDAFTCTNVLAVRGTFNLKSSITFGTRFDEWTGTVKFNGTGAQTVPVEGYYNLTVDKSSGTATLSAGTTTVLGALTITQGTLDAGSATVNLEGNISNSATFTPSSSTIVFTGGSQQVVGSQATNFYNLTIDAGATLQFNNTATPSNATSIGNDWTNNGTFTASDAEVKFTGSASSILGSTTTTFDTVIIDTPATLNVGNTADRLHILSEFQNNGAFTTGNTKLVFAGTGTWSGSTATTVKTIDVIGSLTMGSGDDVTVTTFTLWNTGSFTMDGNSTLRFATGGAFDVRGSFTTSGSTPTITSSPTSVHYSFTVQNLGSLDLNSGNIANLDNDGINIATTASATIDIDNISFTDATAGASGTYIRWQRASPPSNGYTFSGLSFDANCQYNIESPATASVDAFTLTGYGGANGGPTYENDHGAGTDETASSTIEWPSVVWDGGGGTSLWSTAANWSPDAVPTGTDNVKIPSVPSVNNVFPMLNTSTTVGSLLIEDGASVTTDTGARNLTINGSLTLETNAGAGRDAIVSWDSTGTLRVDGALALDGRMFHRSTGVFDFNSSVDMTSSTSRLESSGGGSTDVEGSLTCAGTLQPLRISIAGNLDVSSGTFTPGTSVVTMDGASGTVNIGAGSFYRLSIPSGSTYTAPSSATLTVTNRLVVGGTLNLAGGFSMSGTLDPITGTVKYSGTAAQTISALNYYNLQVTNTGADVTFAAGTSSVKNNFTIVDNATCKGSSAKIQVTGDWTNNHTFTPETSTVSFDGATSSVLGDSKTTFNNLFIASTAALDISTTASPANEIQVNGNFVNDGTFTTGSSHVIFGGTTTLRGSKVTTFDDVTINAASTVAFASTGARRFNWSGDFIDNGTLTAGSSSTIGTTTGAGKTLSGASSETVFNQLEVLGTLTVSGHSLAAKVLNVWGGGTLDIQGSTTLSIGTAATKGDANIYGTFQASGSTPTVTDKGQEYSFDVLSGGVVNIDALVFNNPDDAGLNINATAGTGFDIDGVSFTGGNAATGTYLTISLAGIAANTYSFSSMQFDANTLYNVSTPADAANDAVTCPGWGGSKGGEDYENDKGSGEITGGGSITWPQKQWNGSVSSQWSNASNWTPVNVPSAGENVIIPSGVPHYPHVNITTTVGSLIINQNASVTAAGTRSLTIGGSVQVDASGGGANRMGILTWDSTGTLAIGSGMTINGNFTVGHASSTITVAGNVTVGAAGRLLSTASATNFDIDGSLTNNGTLEPETVKVGGNWVNDGTYNRETGTVTLDGASGTIDTNNNSFYNLVIPSGSTYTAQNENIAITNRLVVPGTLKVKTALTFGTVFNEETGTIEFNGTSAQTIPQEVYYNLTVSTTGGNATVGASYAQVKNDLTVAASSTVTCDTRSLWVSGDLVNNGTFYAGSGNVSFCGASSQVQGSSDTNFHNLYIQTGATLSLNNTASPANTPDIENHFVNNGTFTAGTSTVQFTGAASHLKGSSITTFDNITLASGASLDLRVNGASHNHVGVKSTLTNNGTLTQSLNASGRGNRVIFPNSTGVLAGSSATTLNMAEVYGTLTLGTGDDLTVKALQVNGTLALSGTSIVRLGTASRPGALTSDGTGASITSTGTPTITDKGADFQFDVKNSGVVALSGGTIQNPDDNGINIASSAGAAIDIDSMTFANDDGLSTGTYIQMGDTTIAANTYTWEGNIFNAGCQYNVSTVNNAGVQVSAIQMTGWSGSLGGATYENDKAAGSVTPGSIEWPEKTWDGGGNSSLWSVANNWSPNVVPTAGERVVIPAKASSNNLSPYFNGSFSVGSIVIQSGGSVTNAGAANSITVNGSVEILYDSGSGRGVLSFDAASGNFTCTSVSNDGILSAANNTFTVNGDVRNTRWMSNSASLLDVNGNLVNTQSTAWFLPGRMNISGNFTNGTGSNISATGSVVTFDGTSTQSLTTDGETLGRLHMTGTGTLVLADSFTLANGLSVNSGTVTAGNVTITLGNAALLDVSKTMKFDKTTLTTATPGTNRFMMRVNSGGDLWAKQTTQIKSLNDEGLIFRAGSKMGNAVTTNFRTVTFDNIGDGGLGMDLSALGAGDVSNFPDTIREVRFFKQGGATTPKNVKAGANTPDTTFRLNTGNFGDVATDGESGDDDTSNKITWNASSTWVNLEWLRALGAGVTGDGVSVQWKTLSEFENEGFHVYRSRERHGTYVRLTDEMILAADGAEGSGHLYSHFDPVPVRGELWYYKIEDEDAHGVRTLHGPVCVDWDRDLLPDDWEIAHGLDPNDPSDALADTDGDGLNNLDEYRYGFDPRSADSDGDGIPDGQETLNPHLGPFIEGINAGGQGLVIIGQDPLGMTMELGTSGLRIDRVTREHAGWDVTHGSQDKLFKHKWRPMDFLALRFADMPTEYAQVLGDPKLPVKRVLLNLPKRKSPKLVVIQEEWHPWVSADVSVEPLPRLEDRPAPRLDLVKKTLKRKVMKTFSRDQRTLTGYHSKKRIWASLWGGESYRLEFLEEIRHIEETLEVEENFESEVRVERPGTQLVEVHAMNPASYLQNISAPSALFAVSNPVTVGDQDAFLLTIQAVRYNPRQGRLECLKKLRFRVDYVWSTQAAEADTEAWRVSYDAIHAQKPAYLDFDQVVEVRLRRQDDGVDGDLYNAGLFRLKLTDLAAAGMDTAPLAADPGSLRLFRGNVELSLKEVADGWLFFADTGLGASLYSDRLILHAVHDASTPGRRWGTTASAAGFDRDLQEFTQTIRYEKNNAYNYMESSPDTLFVDSNNVFNTQQKTYSFKAPGASSTGQTVLRARLFAANDFEDLIDQGVTLGLNAQPTYATLWWEGASWITHTATMDASAVPDGTNQLKITGLIPPGLPRARARLDWFELIYPRLLVASQNQILVDAPLPTGITRMSVSGFSVGDSILVADVSDASQVSEFTGTTQASGVVTVHVNGGSVPDSLVFANHLRLDSDLDPRDASGRGNRGFGHDTDSARTTEDAPVKPSGWHAKQWELTGKAPHEGVRHKGRRILFVKESDARLVETCILRTQDNPIRRRRTQVDHLVVADATLMVEAQRLADHLDDMGQTVELVSFQDLCREYTFGDYTSSAVRLYVQERMRTAPSPKPLYLTLVGAGNINTKGVFNFPTRPALIPTPVLRGGLKASAVDHLMAETGEDPFPDLAVGRLDAGTQAELSLIIDKVIAYEESADPLRQPQATLIADTDTTLDPAIFERGVGDVIPSLEVPWRHRFIFRRQIASAPAMTDAVAAAFNDSESDLLLYNGHGNFEDWGLDLFWRGNAVASRLQVGHRLPLVIEANCLSSDWFHLPLVSLGTRMLRLDRAGAVGVIGTTSRTSFSDKSPIFSGVVEQLLRRGYPEMGRALQRAKVETITVHGDKDNGASTMHLLGVPSVKLKGAITPSE